MMGELVIEEESASTMGKESLKDDRDSDSKAGKSGNLMESLNDGIPEDFPNESETALSPLSGELSLHTVCDLFNYCLSRGEDLRLLSLLWHFTIIENHTLVNSGTES